MIGIEKLKMLIEKHDGVSMTLMKLEFIRDESDDWRFNNIIKIMGAISLKKWVCIRDRMGRCTKKHEKGI